MEQTKQIRTRSEIPQEDKWAIEDLYVTEEAWEAEFTELPRAQAELAAFDGRLSESADMLLKYLERSEQLDVMLSKLGNYCMRRADEDTRVAAFQAMTGKFTSGVVALGAATSFDTPQIMAIPEDTLEQFYRDCPKLERYRRYLTNLCRRKAHT